MASEKSINIYCDGGSRGNPGEAAYGFAVFLGEKKIYEEGKRLGINTNNFAEYSGVVNALKYVASSKYKQSLRANALQVVSVNFFLDSKLVVEQLSGKWKIKSENLRSLYHTIKTLELSLGIPISYKHVPREKNTAADRMVNLALDGRI